MNKYIVKATAQIIGFLVVSILGSFAIFRLLDYFNPEPNTVAFGAGMLILCYILVTLIRVQADVLASRDQLNNRK